MTKAHVITVTQSLFFNPCAKTWRQCGNPACSLDAERNICSTDCDKNDTSSNKCIASSNKCIASSNRCIATSNKKLVETTVIVTHAPSSAGLGLRRSDAAKPGEEQDLELGPAWETRWTFFPQ